MTADTMTEKRKHRAPSPVWTLMEGRWVFEMATYYWLRPLFRLMPKGDGHPVIVYPGFLGGPFSTRVLRKFLKNMGYNVYDWEQGRNLRFNSKVEQRMLDKLETVFLKHDQKVSLVGWSLGGVYAREIAKIYPDYVRSVVTLGSPITGPRHASRARPLFELLNGGPSPETAKRIEQLHVPPPVPSTSVYSKTDGVVHWHGSVQDDAPHAENIQILASHVGMGANTLVMYILADRLSQAEGEWKRFDKSGFKRFIFKSPRKFQQDLGDFY